MYNYHQFADIFPILPDDELSSLTESIREKGLDNPIRLYEGQILDGRNRYLACQTLGIEPTIIEFTGTDEDALDFAYRQNIERRHLDKSQRAIAAAKMADMISGMRTDLEPSQDLDKVPVSQGDAAKKLGISRYSVNLANKVLKEAPPEVSDAVAKGHMSVNAANDALDLPKDEQVRIAQSEDPGDEMRDYRKEKATKTAKLKLEQSDCDGDMMIPQITQLIGSVRALLNRGPADEETRRILVKRLDCALSNLQQFE